MVKILRAGAPAIMLALVTAPAQSGMAQQTYSGANNVHYAKTELEKASGKCKVSLIGGTLLGGALGGLIGGKRGVGIGLLGGAAAGGTVCAVMIANAKHRDQIIQAQMAAAMSPSGTYTSNWTDDNGKPVTFVAQAGPVQAMDSAKLAPVRYPGPNGTTLESPALNTGNRDCRATGGSFVGTNATAPQQIYCRTADGNYRPYAEVKA